MANKRFIDQARKWKSSDLSQKEIEKSIREREENKKREAEEKKAYVQIPRQELGRQGEDSVLTLESKVGFSPNISNEVILEAEGQSVKYIGYANGLHFDDGIRGSAFLERYDLVEKVKNVRKRISWFPLKTEVQEVRNQKWVRRWIFKTDGNYKYFLSEGFDNKPEPKIGYKSHEYRGSLKSDAANHDINLASELFDSVFDPIDKKIMEMYNLFHTQQNGK